MEQKVTNTIRGNNRGGRRPGAGRKSKARRYLESLNRHPLSPNTAHNILSCIDMVQWWLDKINDPDPHIGMQAMRYVWDRAEGKATQRIDVQSVNYNFSEKAIQEARRVAEEIARQFPELTQQRAELLLEAPAEATAAEPAQVQTITDAPATPTARIERP